MSPSRTNPTSTGRWRCSGKRRPRSPPIPAWSRLLDGPPEVLGVQQLAERGVTIRTLLRTHPGKQWEVARGFRFRILDRLGRERIAIAAVPSVAALGGGVSRTAPVSAVADGE